MVLYIQTQEKKLIQACQELGIAHETRAFKVADVQNDTGTFVAEVKNSKEDFWSSMVDRRVYNQFREMREQFNGNCYIFIPCNALKALAKERPKNTNWIYSMFGEAENWGVQFREFSDQKDLARKLVSLDKKLGAELKIRDRVVKKYNMTVAEQMACRLPGIGDKLSKELMKTCGTYFNFIDVIRTDKDLLATIKGISKDGKILETAINEMHKFHD